MSYSLLRTQCKPQTIAQTTSRKYLLNTDKDLPPYDWRKDPKQWGPHLWAYLHYSAANYPEKPTDQQIRAMMNWLITLPITIPCDNCSKHYSAYLNKHKSQLYQICSTRDSLFNFLVDIHNKVNERNGKCIMTYEEARQRYFH